MKTATHKQPHSVILIAILVLAWTRTADAQLWRVNEELTIRFANDAMLINRHAHGTERNATEILRGQDLMRSVRDFVDRIKQSLSMFNQRTSDSIRGMELNRITNSNTRDLIERNKTRLQTQRQLMEERSKALQDRTRDLVQRTRDLSWRH